MSGLCGIVDFGAPGLDRDVLRCMAGTPLDGRDGAARAVLDGRLDNRAELIALLRPAEGAAVSDAGLLLEAYRRWGATCTDHLLGDFAFAVWDATARQLLCAVDPLGMKQVHYFRSGPLLVFGSDAFQVLRHPAVPRELDEGEIAAYLGGLSEHPERSFFAAVHRLAPGHRLIATPESFRIERYWQPAPREIVYRRDEEYAEHFRELFQQAVTDRLRTVAGSVAVAMSGGLDSTAVAAVAHRARHETGKAVRAYTFVFETLGECDERAWSSAMTAELGLPVEAVDAERLWALEPTAPLPYSPDTPFVGWRTCYEEIFRRMTQKGSKVLLMGHGGDDLLRGSTRAYAERLRKGNLGAVGEVVRHARSHPEPVARALYRYFGRPLLPAAADRLLTSAFAGRRAPLLPAWVRADFARRAGLAQRQAGLRGPRVFASRARQEVYDHLVAQPGYGRLVHWHDRNAASFGIEVRHPFLDRRLFEYVLALPGDQLFRLGSTKGLLRRAMGGILPEKIRTRTGKTRFSSFLDTALRHDEVREILTSPRAASLGILDGGTLQSACRDFRGVASRERSSLWYTVSLEIWLRRCEACFREVDRETAMGRIAA